MAALKLFPILGMNNVVADDGLQVGGDSTKLFVRDAVNIDVTDTGRIALRKGAAQVSGLNFKNIWQSPLHKDVFATLGEQLVKLNPVTWQYDVLAMVGNSALRYEVVNNLIYIASDKEILIYNGQQLQSLSIATPAAPILTMLESGGALKGGSYSVAISWLRGQQESGLSQVDSGNIEIKTNVNSYDDTFASIQINLPYCLDTSVTEVRVYVTHRNGSELLHYADYPINTNIITITNLEQIGMSARFKGLSPMPTGKYMKYWQGRLITADKNILRFSEPLAYHLHDERFGFVMMPQRITFILPVDGGIWVGQVTHVVFLTGTKPQDMTFQAKTAHAPVPDSAIEIDANDIGGNISQGGNCTALWLAENGYVLGTSSGQIIELQAGILKGVTAKSGRSVRLGRRITTIVT
ncbi:hypothetical protein [Acinetobacter towneri]|uniref:Uncharacterized protein n=1 Tax=Acinetobacter towneri TaxID=202956 RepID=A0A1E8E4Y2_9GAMM|nr:hypothetical protein [Acinetobacter towneri]OFE44634.1 hypothetical protein BJN41_00455 [Acinetobacter towneri]